MKKYLPIVFLFALIGLWACDNDDPAADIQAEAEISLDEDFYLSESDNVQTFTVTTNKAWAISGANDHDWLSIEPSAGGSGTHTVTIKSKSNTSYSYRKATLAFICGTLKKEFSVTQVQNDALTLSAPSFEMSSDGGEIEVIVKSNIDFAVEIPAGSEWIEQIPVTKSGGLVSHTLRFNVGEYNGTTSGREGSIIIKATKEDKSQTIVVTQDFLSGKLPNLVIEKEGSIQTVLASLTTQPDTVTTLNVVGKVDSIDIVYLSKLESLKELKMGRSDMAVSTSGKVRFPSKVLGDHSTLKNFTFPRNIEVIGAQALQNCKQIDCTLEFPENVISIEEKAFAGSTFKGSLELPEKLTSMGANAFDGCTALNGALIIPKTLTEIPAYAFNSCKNLIGQIYIPETVTSIGNRAFYDCQGFKDELIIPESVKSMGNSAFQNCIGLTSIKLSATLKEIPESAFRGCSALTGEIQIPTSILKIGSYAFNGCINITSVTLPDKLEEISSNAFQNCTNLTLSGFPNSLKTIGNYAFYSCKALAGELVLPTELEIVADYSFRDCSGLTSIKFGEKIKKINQHAFYGCTGIKELNLPSGLESIGAYAFRGLSITELNVPNGVKSLNGFAFCNQLTTVTVSETVTEIGTNAFQHCTSLNKITFKDNKVTTFANYCFGNTGFTSFECPESVTTFGTNVFASSQKLTSVRFPSALKNYPKGALTQTPIVQFEIPKGVTSVGESFFSSCTELKEVIIPASLGEIPNYFLSGCTKLTSLTVLAETPPSIQKYSIYNVNSGLEIFVPASSVNAYKAADYWKDYTIKAIN